MSAARARRMGQRPIASYLLSHRNALKQEEETRDGTMGR